jgi:cobalt-zinc-cadmium efflux system membrane fusion protein
MKKQAFLIILLLAGGAVAALAILKINPPAPATEEHGAPQATATAGKIIPEEGPHGGKLLRADGFEVEVTIFEDGVPPEFRIFGYRQGQPLKPEEFKATIELQRLDKKNTFTFQPREDYLIGDGTVKEPHSFDVTVKAEHGGKTGSWAYESYEGRATIAPEYAKAAGLVVAQAGPATIKETLTLHGVVTVDADRVARVGARFAGVVKEVRKQLGDQVTVGEVLAVVESNESLQSYEVKAPQAGVITERNVTAGSVTGEAALFVITDLSSVWVELNVFATDARKLKAGLPATVRTPDGAVSAEIVLGPFLPSAVTGSQTRVIRVRLANPEGHWAPGLRVMATVQLPPHQASLAVKNTGLQAFRDFTVVFAQVGDTYEVRMLELGRTDGEFIEVLGGLDLGERYVAANSFLVKADAMKSGASHDH